MRLSRKTAPVILILAVFLVLAATPSRAAFVDEKIDKLVEEGDKFIHEKKYSEALDKYKEAMELNPAKPVPHYKIGVAYFFLKDLDQAVAQFKEAIKINPDYVKAMNNLGQVLELQGKKEEALALYKKAVEKKPKYLKARYNLCVLLVRQKKFDQAQTEAQELLKISPDYHKAYYLLGIIQEYKGQYRHAEEMYLKCLSMSADYPPAAQGMKRMKERIAAESANRGEEGKARKVVEFRTPDGFRFISVQDLMTGARLITLNNEMRQVLQVVKFPNTRILGDKDFKELVGGERKEFKEFLQDMKITALEITGEGEFPSSEAKEPGVKKEAGTDPEGEDLEPADEPAGDETESAASAKTRNYYRVKCIQDGYDREGIMIEFRFTHESPPLLFISIAPPGELNLKAAREFYESLRPPKS